MEKGLIPSVVQGQANILLIFLDQREAAQTLRVRKGAWSWGAIL